MICASRSYSTKAHQSTGGSKVRDLCFSQHLKLHNHSIAAARLIRCRLGKQRNEGYQQSKSDSRPGAQRRENQSGDPKIRQFTRFRVLGGN
jgi:hypothetical protein